MWAVLPLGWFSDGGIVGGLRFYDLTTFVNTVYHIVIDDDAAAAAAVIMTARHPFHHIAIAPLNQATIVVRQNLRTRNNTPLDAPEKLQLQQSQLLELDTSDACIRLVGPETVAETFTGHGSCRDEEPVHGETRNGEGRVQGAEPVDVEDHTEQNGGGEGGVSG